MEGYAMFTSCASTGTVNAFGFCVVKLDLQIASVDILGIFSIQLLCISGADRLVCAFLCLWEEVSRGDGRRV